MLFGWKRFDGSKESTSITEKNEANEQKQTISGENKNHGLLYCKLFYFFFNSAMGSLWPYFPLYFRQQFLTPRQVGAIVASRTLVQFLFVPFWCAIAEKFNKHKQLLTLGILAWLISTLAILAVPREEPKACLQMNRDDSLRTKFHSKDWFDFTPLTKSTTSTLNSVSTAKGISSSNQENNLTISLIVKEFNKVKSERHTKMLPVSHQSKLVRKSVKSRSNHKQKLLSSTKNIIDFVRYPAIVVHRYKREHDGIDDDYYSPATMFNTSTDFATIYEEYDPQKHITDSSRAFILLLIITIIGVSLASPAQTLVDICTMKKLASEKQQTFGKQVVWAAIGSASFAFLVGTLVSFFKVKNPCTRTEDIDYSPCFYAFTIFMIVTLGISDKINFDKSPFKPSNHVVVDLDESIANFWECVKTINDVHLASLLVVMFYCGFGNGFISTFLYWHLREMGGAQILLALVSLINNTAEVLFYIVSEQLMDIVGHFRLIYIGLFCFSARFFYYSFLRQPWLVLPIEIAHGMTSAAIRSSMISYLRQEGTAGHLLHGIFNGIHGGLGFSIGGLVGGLMVHNYGHTITFLIFGELSLLTLFCFVLVNNVWPYTKHEIMKNNQKTLNKSMSFDGKHEYQKRSTDFKIFGNENVDHSFHNLSTILLNSHNEDSIETG